MDHHKHAEHIHQGREDGHQHNFRIGYTGKFRHDKSAGPHNGWHEHPGNRGRRFDPAGNVRPEPGFLHHGNGERTGGDDIGNGAAGDGAEKPGGDHGDLGRTADFVPDRGQGKIDEKLLGAALFKKSTEQDEQKHIRGQDIGHDPEHAVTFIKDTGAHLWKGIAGMGEEIRHVGPVDAVKQQKGSHNDKRNAHHPPGQLDAYEDPDHSHRLVKVRFNTGAVIDCFEIQYPVTHAKNGKHNEQVVHPPQPFIFRFIDKKYENIGDDHVNPPVVLGGGGRKDGRVGVEKNQADRQDVKDDFFNFV